MASLRPLSILVRDAMTVVSSAAEPLEPSVLAISPDEPLDSALEQLTDLEISTADVVENGQIIGTVSTREIMTTYRSTLGRSIRRARALTPDTALFEIRVGPNSRVIGRELRHVRFPAETLVVSVSRQGESIFPKSTTVFREDDMLMVMVSPDREGDLRTFLNVDDEPIADPEAS